MGVGGLGMRHDIFLLSFSDSILRHERGVGIQCRGDDWIGLGCIHPIKRPSVSEDGMGLCIDTLLTLRLPYLFYIDTLLFIYL